MVHQFDIQDDEIPEDMTREQCNDLLNFLFGEARETQPITEEDITACEDRFYKVLAEEFPDHPWAQQAAA